MSYRMRQNIFIIACVTLCVFLISCQRGKNPGMSYELKSHNEPHIGAKFCQSERSAFWITEDERDGIRSICYYDFISETSGFLCGKAECTHESDSCDAAAGEKGSGSGLCYYENRLYWMADRYDPNGGYLGRYLLSEKTDGTDRQIVRQLYAPDDQLNMITGNMLTLCVGGYYVISGDAHIVENGENINVLLIEAFPMKEDSCEVIFREEGEGRIYICASYDLLYYSVVNQDDRSEDESWKQNSYLRLYLRDFPLNKSECLFDEAVSFYLWEFAVISGKLVLTTMSDLYSDCQLYSFDLVSRELKKEFDFPGDSKDTYANIGNTYAVLYKSYRGHSKRELTLKDLETNEVSQFSVQSSMMDSEGRGFSRIFAGSNQKFLFYIFRNYTDDGRMIEYVTAYMPETCKEIILWKSE